MKTLNVMSLDFNYKAALGGYDDAILTRQWSGIGVMNLTIKKDVPNANLIAIDDILWFDKEYHKAFIVERIHETLENNVTTLTVTAPHIDCLLKDFITVPPEGSSGQSITGTREEVVRGWINSNTILDLTRNQYPIALGTLQGLGATITENTRYRNLVDEINRVLAPEELGWNLTLDIPNSQFVFNVQKGIDRTVIPRVIFGVKYGNLASYRKLNDITGAKTIAYVGGQGVGVDRSIVVIDSGYTGRKKEVFVDARDIDGVDKLTERGHQVLSEKMPIENFEFETLNRQFAYETDWDLGDYVTVVESKDKSQNIQIKSIREYYERGNIRVIPEFGKPVKRIQDLITDVSNKVSNLENI